MIHSLERLGIKVIEAMAPAAVFANEVREPQKAKVLGNGGPRSRKRPRNLPGRQALAPQQIKYGTAGRICQGVENAFGRMRN